MPEGISRGAMRAFWGRFFREWIASHGKTTLLGPYCGFPHTPVTQGGQRCLARVVLTNGPEEGYRDPWLILTDLPPDAGEAGWYGLRAWIEQPCKCIKRAGWPWQRTRMTQPARAARLWLAVAVATRWLLSVGGMAEETIPESTRLDVSAALASQRRPRRATRLRLVSIFRRGWITILVALLTQALLPLGAFRPEPWPSIQPFEASQSVADPEVHDHVAA